ncbi:Centromere protein Q [Bagarius yarrelli]|uniref:Centromere protein Q n=1 Tax=Bagarius yarrelli TaxID=175774 RepID=A0A556TKE1_BAGYA|nr:Centromere protein Q [Bagarius yarrelli]
MKPARGSSRASTQRPKSAGGEKKNSQQVKLINELFLCFSGHDSAPAHLRKVKGQEKWKPLDKPSIKVLDNMLSLSILSVLTMKSKEKEESQKHLNFLKDKFLAECSRLPVPPQKHGNIMQLSQQFHTENQKVKDGKKRLEALEWCMIVLKKSSQEVVSQLEQLQVKMDRLQHECKTMKEKLEKEELNAPQFIQLTEQAVLHLPALACCPENEPTLQEAIMKVVPDPKAVLKTLQERRVSRDVKAFLQLAHKQTDHL